jgi:hypothetical protein
MRCSVDAQDLLAELESSDLADDPASVPNVRKVELAKAALQFAIGLLEAVADDTGDEHARAYLVDQLKVHANADHGFLSRDFNLDQWIEQLEECGDEEGAVK